jgi:hypothetical protein
LGLLAGEGAENVLECHYASEVDQRQHRREKTVDEGTVDDYVYLLGPIAQDGHTDRDRGAYESDQAKCLMPTCSTGWGFLRTWDVAGSPRFAPAVCRLS